ncbi:phytoene desaturase family protein [Dankookia sp. P2]|uniref:phytoene desaturase family protein n=1 Tax=Dankookia sp. P2 TaxID=3423955 RepID=UPI003D665B78
MNAPLAAPALKASRPRVAIVGAGPGGLAAAMLLAAQGAQVTIFEKDKVVGGRTRTLATPEGFRFDLGPTFFLYPRVIAEIFQSVGARLEDEVKLMRVDPLYRLFFEGAASIDATADPVRMEAEIAKLCPQDAKGFRGFIAENRAKLDVFRPVLEKPFASIFRFLHPEVLKSLPLLRPHSTVDKDLARHFSHPLVRLAFSFQTKYLGMSPFRCPSLFTILSFLEYEHGIWHIEGGCGSISDAMARVAERLGAEIRFEAPVECIAFDGRRATGLTVGGVHHAADAVIVNADFAHSMPYLVPQPLRPRWKDAKIETARYSCSTFMLYLGIEGSYPDLAHHTVMLSEGYERNIRRSRPESCRTSPASTCTTPASSIPAWRRPGIRRCTCWCRCRTCAMPRRRGSTGGRRRRASAGWCSTGWPSSGSAISNPASATSAWSRRLNGATNTRSGTGRPSTSATTCRRCCASGRRTASWGPRASTSSAAARIPAAGCR